MIRCQQSGGVQMTTQTAPLIDDHPIDEGCRHHPKCQTCPYPKCVAHDDMSYWEKQEMLSNPMPASEPEPEPVEKPDPPVSSVWRRPSWWAVAHHIPTICPHCGGTVIQDGYPDEVFCFWCFSSTILSWVHLPEGYHSPPLFTTSIVLVR